MSHDKINHLCRLPDELLGSIFTLAQSSDRSLYLPISKRLLPFLRYYLYHRVRLTSYRSLDLFCSSVQSSPSLLNLIKSLDIRIEFVPGRAPAREAQDHGDPSNAILTDILSKSSEVGEISIYGSTRIAFMLLVSDVMSRALPKLSCLRLTSTFFRIDHPWHPSHYAQLSLSRLAQLRLTIVRTRGSISRDTRTEGSFPVSPISVRELFLEGPIVPQTGLERLLPAFNQLSTLSVIDTHNGACDLASECIETMLSAIDPQTPLQSLKVIYDCTRTTFHLLDRHGIDCSMLSALSTLTVGGASICDEAEFYSQFRDLPLETITFEQSADVSLSELIKLITPSGKHQSLKTIVLNNIDGRIGPRIENVGQLYWNAGKGEWSIHPGWVLPAWNSEFDEKGLIRFLEIASGAGVEVKGSALKAIGVNGEFEQEWEVLAAFEERIGLEELTKEMELTSLGKRGRWFS